MRSALFGFLAAALAVGLSARPAPAAEPLDKAKEEAALQKNAEAFVEAFNKGDAKAVAAFFTEDGDIIDQDGRQIKAARRLRKSTRRSSPARRAPSSSSRSPRCAWRGRTSPWKTA